MFLMPDPQYLDLPPESFLGGFCNIKFVQNDATEYMWVCVTECNGEELSGGLKSQPAVIALRPGDTVKFTRDEIVRFSRD